MKIYVRERAKIKEGVKQPRYRVVAIVGDKDDKVKVAASHFRKVELEQLAKDLSAELIYLEPMPEEEHGKMKK
ncbi:hypothetical protein F1737_00870 [Methanoplanus sp. FWC-SCC4]|uniref:Uncharacterized protein n=1 Tax=Methanochimaera problematica TaxID=2609417 RepID=A0AA97FB56_9EURY|nr:hypothetical protein [Methanoplanus sp. FWC-SCC4]WOF15332.1 hypothetical protein F1737_00870 [Methanoplanus sp. FWC-SCC4]